MRDAELGPVVGKMMIGEILGYRMKPACHDNKADGDGNDQACFVGMGHGVQSPVKVRAILVTPTKSSLPEPSTGMAETTSTFHMSGSSGQYALRMLKTNP